MNELAVKQEEYEHLLTRYLEDVDEEKRIMVDLMRCKERLGEKQWGLTDLAYQIRDLRKEGKLNADIYITNFLEEL